MMLIKCFFVLIFVMIATSLARAQQDSLTAKKVSFHTIASEYVPQSQIQVTNFNLGTEIVLKNNKSLTINFGYLEKQNPTNGGLFSFVINATQGCRGQLELKHYLRRHKLIEPLVLVFWPHLFLYKSQTLLNSGYYVSGLLGYQYTSSERNETISNYDNITNQNQFINSIYNVKRNSLSLIVKAGYQCIKPYGLLIDVSFGFGAQWLDTELNNKIGGQASKEFPWKQTFEYRQGIFPQVRYQIKLGWAF